ncbi:MULTISPECIES: hypothetical protein [Bacillaceae]|nr:MULTISPECIES: hypothetical protein [Bacillaceae]
MTFFQEFYVSVSDYFEGYFQLYLEIKILVKGNGIEAITGYS